jgi:hypothetical protein
MTLDHQSPATREGETRLELLCARDGSVELRAFGNRRHRVWGVALALVWLIAMFGIVYGLLVDMGRGAHWLLLPLIAAGAYLVLRWHTDERSAHRVIASASGLVVERVSPGGYLKRRVIPRERVRRIDAKFRNRNSAATIWVTTGWWPMTIRLADIEHAELAAAVDAIRDAVGLTPHSSSV